jgi:hypothetical protein
MRKNKDVVGLLARWGTAVLVASSAGMGIAACTGSIGGGTQGIGSGGNGGPAAGGANGNTGNTGNGNGNATQPGETTTVPPTSTSGTTLGNVPLGPMDTAGVVMRRLNDHEYDNTVRDLLGTTQTLAATTFPGDSADDGFDTVGDALSFSPVLFQKEFAAATTLVTELMARSPTDPLFTAVFPSGIPTSANFSSALTTVLTSFMPKAWRRPVTTAEVATAVAVGEAVLALADDAGAGLSSDGGAGPDPAQAGVSDALQYVLDSPNFLFHVELGSPAITPSSTALANLSNYELASRLSYYLWESMPDATLTAQAAAGTLAATGTPGSGTAGSGVAAQVTRMIADPKFTTTGFIADFVGQWLGVTTISSNVNPDPTMFPATAVGGMLDPTWLNSIAPETDAFLSNLITTDAPLTELLTADYTFVNGRLAQFYGLTGVPASQTTFTKVSLAGTERLGGILTQETFLTTTSFPNRTSPVLRGVYVMEQLVGTSPGTPPANVPAFVVPDAGSGETVRESLDQHANNPACSSCHNEIDPIGYTFENFDATGAYRTLDNGSPIDATGTLYGQTINATGQATYNGASVNGAAAMAAAVVADPRFPQNIVKQLLTYGVGRTFDTAAALGYVETVAAPLAKSGTWQTALQTVATSQAFMTTRGGSQ